VGAFVTNVQYINFVQKWVKWYVEVAVDLLIILEGLFMYSALAVERLNLVLEGADHFYFA
jgi:hypothetical protein